MASQQPQHAFSRRQQGRALLRARNTRQRQRREAKRFPQQERTICDPQVTSGRLSHWLKAVFCRITSCRKRRTTRVVSSQMGESELQLMQAMTWEEAVSHYEFGPAAFGPLEAVPIATITGIVDENDSGSEYLDLQGQVETLVLKSVPAVKSLRGQRGERLVTEMLMACYDQGLFMHGPPSSPLNCLIIPAIRHIFQEMNKLPPSHGKRIDCLSTLAYACQDCQQVQAREIMRIYGDLTAQNATLEKQFKYTLMRDKEAALQRFISEHHPRCDLDWTEVSPWQQRPHLMSGYTALIGDAFGLDSVTAARSDRYLSNAQREIGEINCEALISELRQGMSLKDWLQMLLADINNQTEGADRLIDRQCIFKWVHENMDAESAYLVFYDEDRKAEFDNLDPPKPTDANKFQPFLSLRVLVNILVAAGLLVEKEKETFG